MSMDRISGKAKEWVGKGEEAVGEALEDGRVRAREPPVRSKARCREPSAA